MSLESVADELYGLPLAEFTAARNASATTEPAAKSLKKPSAAAWALNQFARRRSAELDQVFSLGEQLRDAQDDLDAASLRALGSQRRQLVSAIAKQVGDLATELGDAVGASIILEVEQTLQAAMADARAADALRTGRLVRSLSTAGLDEVDLEGAVAGAVPATPRRARTGPTPEQKKKLQKAVDDAQAAADSAVEAQTEARNRADEAAQRTHDLEAKIADLTARLADAREQLSDSRVAAKRLAAEHSAATTESDRAAERLRDARDTLEASHG